jgi:hypothetical protein
MKSISKGKWREKLKDTYKNIFTAHFRYNRATKDL